MGKWYVKQMKQFNFMNCRAIEMSGKMGVRQVAWTSLFNCKYVYAFENLFLRHQKRPPPLH